MLFFKPRLPVTQDEGDWIDDSIMRLIEMFGSEYFLSRRTILPKPEFFPDKFAPTEEGLERLVARMCGYMDVDAGSVDFHIFSEEMQNHSIGEHQSSGAAGKYFGQHESTNKYHIAIELALLAKPLKLVATIAHELGHVILLGGNRIDPDEDDQEYLTDLFTVFSGMGIFTANAAFEFSQWQGKGVYGWSSSRQGYMSQSMFGYSLAVCAWLRKEFKVPWESDLNANVRHAFKNGMKFLQNTNTPHPALD